MLHWEGNDACQLIYAPFSTVTGMTANSGDLVWSELSVALVPAMALECTKITDTAETSGAVSDMKSVELTRVSVVMPRMNDMGLSDANTRIGLSIVNANLLF